MERDYARSTELFTEAAGLGRGDIGALLAYSMCRAGLRDKAKAVKGADGLAPVLRCWSP